MIGKHIGAARTIMPLGFDQDRPFCKVSMYLCHHKPGSVDTLPLGNSVSSHAGVCDDKQVAVQANAANGSGEQQSAGHIPHKPEGKGWRH